MEFETLHPLIVHFPIALLIVSVVFALGWTATGAAWWRNALLILVTIGAGGAFFAVESGEELKDAEGMEQGGWGEMRDLVEEHEEWAEVSMYASGATAIFLLGIFAFGFMRKTSGRDPIALRLIGLVATVACAATVGVAGHRGGLLVWGEFDEAGSAEGSAEH